MKIKNMHHFSDLSETKLTFYYILGRKSYSLQKYFFILMIVAGVALFIYKVSDAELKTWPNTNTSCYCIIFLYLFKRLTCMLKHRLHLSGFLHV